MIRKFEKEFTRRFSLITVQYWYEGERFGLEKLTHGAMYFNPIFLSNQKEGISVYYDTNNPKTSLKPLLKFFKNKNNLFKTLSKKYLENVSILQNKLNDTKLDNLEFIYKTVIYEIWPMITASVLLGREGKTKGLEEIAITAIGLRQKTDKFEYQLSEKISQLVAENFPEYKEYAEFLTIEEVLSKNFPSERELGKRIESFVFFEGKLMIGKSKREIEKDFDIKILIPKLSTTKITQINGSPASLGKVKGKVRILLSSKEIDKIQKGEILVTHMTTPDYFPALVKAAAFITDKGGITSHAAIVARELKKPCIVGTKIATKVLKDGDFVEVDADKGIIRIITS